MQKFTSIWIGISIIILAVGGFWIWVSAVGTDATTQGHIPAPKQGFLAPDFSLPTIDGDSITLSELRGKPVLINFWATWCPPCRTEMPAIQNVYDDYKDQDFVVLAVNTTYQDNLGDAITFAQIRRLTFPILLDQDGGAANLYEVRALPTTYFIGANGFIQDVVVGGPMSETLLQIRSKQLVEGEQ